MSDNKPLKKDDGTKKPAATPAKKSTATTKASGGEEQKFLKKLQENPEYRKKILGKLNLTPAETAEVEKITPGTREGFVQIHFSSKPAESVRNELKNAGFRWSTRNRVWYGPKDTLPERYKDVQITV